MHAYSLQVYIKYLLNWWIKKSKSLVRSEEQPWLFTWLKLCHQCGKCIESSLVIKDLAYKANTFMRCP